LSAAFDLHSTFSKAAPSIQASASLQLVHGSTDNRSTDSHRAPRRQSLGAVRSICLHGIKTGNATSPQTAPDWKEWDAGHLTECRMVARPEQEVLGWAGLSPVSSRPVYRGVLGSEADGIWTLQAGLFPENTAVKLHTNAGFRIVGTRSRLGFMNGLWRNGVLMKRRCFTIAYSHTGRALTARTETLTSKATHVLCSVSS
jgi:L-amino acid N-acyltransferase YncA